MMIQEILGKIQTELVAPKTKHNKFGDFKYRNIEDLTNAVKPLLKEHNAALTLSDEIIMVGDRVYIKATAALRVGAESVEAYGWAREPLAKKGMDDSQITGSTSSYARKYAFSGLFAIDGEKDADDDPPKGKADDALITEAQANIIYAMMDEADLKADVRSSFLKYVGVSSVESISADKYKTAVSALEAKIKSMVKP
jgi:hypothetical protein